MPSNIIASFAQKSGRAEADVEHMWNSLKRELTSRGMVGDQLYSMIVGIMKKNLKVERKEMELLDKYLVMEKVTNEYQTKTGKYPTQTTWVVQFDDNNPNEFAVYTRFGVGLTLQRDYIQKHPKFKSIDDAVKWMNKKFKWKLGKI